MQCKPPPQKTPKTAKKPKKITESYLHNAGLYYLQRFSASKKQFCTVMERKIKKSCAAHEDQDYGSCIETLTRLADKFEDLGLLNDEIYARAQVTSLRRQGKSKKAIMAKLTHKGIDPDLGSEKLRILDIESNDDEIRAEYNAALTFSRKKKIGPYAPENKITQQDREKDLAKLARAGFSYEISRKILESEDR